MRRIAILAEGAFEWHYGKTGIGVIRYGKDPVVAVIDSTKAGHSSGGRSGDQYTRCRHNCAAYLFFPSVESTTWRTTCVEPKP